MYISELNIYPIKSLGGILLEKSLVEERGLQFDRRYMLVDENGMFLTQRENSQMATIRCRLNGSVEVQSEKQERNLSIPFDFTKWFESDLIEVEIWNSRCPARVASDEINKWFCDALDLQCRLVEMPVSTRRQINSNFNQGDEVVSFADGYPVLIIGESSLADLNSKLEKQIPMNRFRPNLVVSGVAAFAEDNWKKIKIGNTIFRSTKPCARCVITTIDQKTGVSDIQEPLKTLAKYRRSTDVFPQNYSELGLGKNDVLFGQNLVAENFGEEIKVGDQIEIIE
jgi:uncharacterized protein YcbX